MGSNVQNGDTASFDSHGGPAKLHYANWPGNNSFVHQYGITYHNVQHPDLFVEPRLSSLVDFSWRRKVASVKLAKMSGRFWAPKPNGYTPQGPVRGGNYPTSEGLGGDSGPAGGIIVSTPNANGGTGGNYYYEASPVDIASSLASCNADESGLTNAYTAIGLGSAATNVLIGICASGGAVTAKNYSLNGFSDWFLPTRDEAVQICKYARQLTEGAASCTGGTLRGGFANGLYVTSSSGATHNYAWHVMFDGSGPTYIGMSAGAVRALRVFSP